MKQVPVVRFSRLLKNSDFTTEDTEDAEDTENFIPQNTSVTSATSVVKSLFQQPVSLGAVLQNQWLGLEH
jgi:hypothetical protein